MSIGGPDNMSAAMSLIDEAAALGSGEAIARQAYFNALGWSGAPDLARDVALLAQAAERGWPPAHDELRLLNGGVDGSPSDMARRVDVNAFMAPRRLEAVSTSPRIWTAPGFMTAAECRWVTARAAPRLEAVKVYEGDKTHHSPLRSNTGAEFRTEHLDLVVAMLQRRISNTVGIPATFFEATTVLHYEVGQEFVRHVDYLSPAQPGVSQELAVRGQRIATFLVYLNDGYEGGETDFPHLKYRYRGKPGDALTFANTHPDMSPDPRTLHAGLPPTSGEKWLLSQWIRGRPQ